MSHANITNKNGNTESVTEFNGEISVEVSKQAAVSMEVTVLNKNMKVLFIMVPRIYYMLPWRFRLFPRPAKKHPESEAAEERGCTALWPRPGSRVLGAGLRVHRCSWRAGCPA